MDERLGKALEFANYRQTLNTQLHRIKTKTEGLLILAKNGGSFHITQELICFLDYLERTGVVQANLLDRNNVPVQISNVSDFLKEVTGRYFEVTNDYLQEYQQVRKARNVKSILDLRDSE